jgi:phage terminase small subunit
MADELTGKQKLFVSEYLKDFNATRSAIAAGYSAKTAAVIGHELLRKPKIQEAIRKHVDAALDADKITLKKIIVDELKKTALDDESRDRIKALELLGKYLSLFTDKVEISGEIHAHFDPAEKDI